MENLQGQLLLAAPSMLDPNFERAVILMVEHGTSGALGLILNRPTQLSVHEAVEDGVESAQGVRQVLRKGGPCEGPLMVLHGDADSSQLEVMPGVHFATEQELVESVMTAHDPAGAPAMFFAGYAGWGPGQLEEEIMAEAWLVVAAKPDEVFTAGPDSWSQLVRRLAKEAMRASINPNIIPPDPSVN